MIIDFNEPVYSYDKFVSDIKALAEQYGNILQYVTVGQSHDNRDIILLKLGVGKKYMLCTSGVHGRETINPIVLMRIIEYYAELYSGYKVGKENLKRKLKDLSMHLGTEYRQIIFSECVYELLQTFTILFIPILNPDGYTIALEGFDSIRNTQYRARCIRKDIPYSEWKYNARGADINRNFPSKLWKPKNDCDYAASENETKALISVFHDYKLRGFIDFHSRGKSIYYYRSQMSDIYNERQLKVARRIKDITKYELVPPSEEIDKGDSGGNTVHYFSEHFFKTALTIETVEETASFPLDTGYRQPTFEEIKFVVFEFGSLII